MRMSNTFNVALLLWHISSSMYTVYTATTSTHKRNDIFWCDATITEIVKIYLQPTLSTVKIIQKKKKKKKRKEKKLSRSVGGG